MEREPKAIGLDQDGRRNPGTPRLISTSNSRRRTLDRHLRGQTLLPQIAVFGGAASGRIMSRLLAVGKVLPEIAELAHIVPRPPQSTTLPAVLGVAEESFSHLSDHRTTTAQALRADLDENSSPLGRFGVETLPAGTRLQTWVRLTNATAMQAAFLSDVLADFANDDHLGGRIAAGHGQVTATVTAAELPGELPDDSADCVADLSAHRSDAIAALAQLS